MTGTAEAEASATVQTGVVRSALPFEAGGPVETLVDGHALLLTAAGQVEGLALNGNADEFKAHTLVRALRMIARRLDATAEALDAPGLTADELAAHAESLFDSQGLVLAAAGSVDTMGDVGTADHGLAHMLGRTLRVVAGQIEATAGALFEASGSARRAPAGDHVELQLQACAALGAVQAATVTTGGRA